MMPLYITKDLAAVAYKQLKDEQAVRQYHTICDLLDVQTVQEVLNSSLFVMLRDSYIGTGNF